MLSTTPYRMQKARRGAAFLRMDCQQRSVKTGKTPYEKDIIQDNLDKKTLEFLYESARMKLLFCETIAL